MEKGQFFKECTKGILAAESQLHAFQKKSLWSLLLFDYIQRNSTVNKEVRLLFDACFSTERWRGISLKSEPPGQLRWLTLMKLSKMSCYRTSYLNLHFPFRYYQVIVSKLATNMKPWTPTDQITKLTAYSESSKNDAYITAEFSSQVFSQSDEWDFTIGNGQSTNKSKTVARFRRSVTGNVDLKCQSQLHCLEHLREKIGHIRIWTSDFRVVLLYLENLLNVRNRVYSTKNTMHDFRKIRILIFWIRTFSNRNFYLAGTQSRLCVTFWPRLCENQKETPERIRGKESIARFETGFREYRLDQYTNDPNTILMAEPKFIYFSFCSCWFCDFNLKCESCMKM